MHDFVLLGLVIHAFSLAVLAQARGNSQALNNPSIAFVDEDQSRSMPQLGLLFMLVFLPMNMLSGSNTPLESMPPWLAFVMQGSPSTHFVSFAQSILYRGNGLDVVWPQFLTTALIGGPSFGLALLRFRSVAAQTS